MEWVDVLDILRTILEVIAGAFFAICLLFLFICILFGVLYAIFYVVNILLKPFHAEIKSEHLFKIIFYPFYVVNKIWVNRKRIRDYIMVFLMGCVFIAFLGLCIHQCYGDLSNNINNEEELEDIPPRGVPSRYW